MSDETPDTTGLREGVEALTDAEMMRLANFLDFYNRGAESLSGLVEEVGGILANHVAAAREADRAEEKSAWKTADELTRQLTKHADALRASEKALAGLVAKIEAEAHRLLAEDPHYTSRSASMPSVRGV